MKKMFLLAFLSVIFPLVLHTSTLLAQVSAPVLKWDRGGCTSWCMTGWYASPAVADLDNDSFMEIIWASYKVFVVDGITGTEKWSVYTGHDMSYTGSSYVGRTWPGVVVANVDNNPGLEIVTAHSGGYVSVYDNNGYFLNSNWPRQPAPSSELRSLALFDLDNDNDLEIIVASTSNGADEEWYVYEHDGIPRAGNWPQLSSGGYAAGCYNENIAVADIDNDGKGEIIAPSDVHYICSFEDDGTRRPTNSIYGGKFWGEVGVWVDLAPEIRGWGNCDIEHRPNFADTAPIIVDVNNDSNMEVVFVGNVYDCSTLPYTDLYHMVYILNPDRSRFNSGGYDWTVIPVPMPPGSGAPLSENYSIIETCMPNPAAADIDGDTNLEIVFSSYDGKVHCYWLDKTERYNWPYSVYNPSEGFYRFASEPVIADLDNDGKAEIIFGSWTEKSSNQPGKLHILDYQGNPIHEIDVPSVPGQWNGILGAPTLANIDTDPDLEIVVGTAHSGICAYDLPGTSSARVLWGTGRANYMRTGSQLTSSSPGVPVSCYLAVITMVCLTGILVKLVPHR